MTAVPAAACISLRSATTYSWKPLPQRPASAEFVEPMEEALVVAEEERPAEHFRRKRRLRSRINVPAMDNE